MGRVLFFVALGIAIYLLWRWAARSQLGDPRSRPSRQLPAEAMVSCAKCGLHVPRIEALPYGERYYCSEEHRRQASEG